MIWIADPKGYLSEWMTRFVKNKDLIARSIEEIGPRDELVIAKLKDGKEHAYLVEPFIDKAGIDSALSKIKGFELCSLVVYNTQGNFDTLIKNWENIAKFKKHFNIYFVNPFSKTEKRWAIYPMTHNLITDKTGLKPGLMVLFSTVEPITEAEIRDILKSDKSS